MKCFKIERLNIYELELTENSLSFSHLHIHMRSASGAHIQLIRMKSVRSGLADLGLVLAFYSFVRSKVAVHFIRWNDCRQSFIVGSCHTIWSERKKNHHFYFHWRKKKKSEQQNFQIHSTSNALLTFCKQCSLILSVFDKCFLFIFGQLIWLIFSQRGLCIRWNNFIHVKWNSNNNNNDLWQIIQFLLDAKLINKQKRRLHHLTDKTSKN